MYFALRQHCLNRWDYRKKLPGTPVLRTRRGRSREFTARPGSASTRTLTKEPMTAPTILKTTLCSQVFTIAINGVEDRVAYLPLHLVEDKKPLKKPDLLSDEMIANAARKPIFRSTETLGLSGLWRCSQTSCSTLLLCRQESNPDGRINSGALVVDWI